MKSTVENLNPTRVKLTIEVPFDEMGESIDAAYKRISSQVNVPGFRKGKVPSQIIDQRVGRGAVLEEAVNEMLPAAYESAVAENELVIVSQPEVEVTDVSDNDKVVFTAEVDIRPEFEVADYSDVSVEVEDSVIDDAKVDEQLEELRKRFGTAVPVDRAAADEDLVLIDVVGSLDGERLEDYCATALSYEVGSAGMVSGADAAIRGLSKDDTTTFTFTLEEGEQIGREIDLAVDVKEVRERSLPDADDEFAQLASEFDTLDELKADLRERVEKMALVEQGMAAREKVLDFLLDNTEIHVPESMLAAQVDEHFQDGHSGDDDDAHRAEVEEDTRKAIKTQFILDKVADTEQVAVGQAELSQWLVSQAPRYGMTPDQFAEALVQGNQVQMAVADVRRGKALAKLLQQATVTDASGKDVDLSSLDEAVEEEREEEALEELEDEIVEEAIEEIAEIEAIEEASDDAQEPAAEAKAKTKAKTDAEKKEGTK